MENKSDIIEATTQPESPFAKYEGSLKLGDSNVDCFVSDTGKRLVSMRATVRAIANVESGKLENYIGITALNPFINLDEVLSEMIELNIPGNHFKAICLESNKFLDICRAYAAALSADTLSDKPSLTDRQREIAIKCSILLSAMANVGLDALI